MPVTLDIDLQRGLAQPLFVQLSDQIRRHITEGKIHGELPLPASRVLAAELGISRGTVISAYEQLVAEGYIAGRRGSGYYARPLSGAESPPRRRSRPVAEEPGEHPGAASPLQHPGYPDHRLFPCRQWARSMARSARVAPRSLIVSESPFGDASLRRSIASYLAEWRGLEVSPQQVMVTAGSVDALETCIRTLTAAGDVVGLENPGYRPLRNLVANQGMRIEWLPVGNNGAELPRATRRKSSTRLVVVTPSHQFPLGGAMPANRRLEYQQWASANGAWIVEDDYDSEFRYAGRPIPALASLDDAGRSIYVGTFSKVFSVSLRLAYLIMPDRLVDDFGRTLSRYGVRAALPCQRPLADFIDSGDLYRHIRRVRRIYADRRRVLLDCLQRDLPGYLEFTDHQAGMQIAAMLPGWLDDHDISDQARQRGVLVAPLSSYYGDNSAQVRQGLLLGFCPLDEKEIRDSVKILGEIIEAAARRAS